MKSKDDFWTLKIANNIHTSDLIDWVIEKKFRLILIDNTWHL